MAKKLDKDRYHITVHGKEESGQSASFMQDGVYFDGDGNELGSVGKAEPVEVAKPAPAKSAVDAQITRQMSAK